MYGAWDQGLEYIRLVPHDSQQSRYNEESCDILNSTMQITSLKEICIHISGSMSGNYYSRGMTTTFVFLELSIMGASASRRYLFRNAMMPSDMNIPIPMVIQRGCLLENASSISNNILNESRQILNLKMKLHK